VSKMFDPRNGPGIALSLREPKASTAAEVEWSHARAGVRLARKDLSIESGESDEESDP